MSEELKQKLWRIADTLRGKMDADDFRDYILGFIFYKYLSEKMHDYANDILKPDKLKYEDLLKHKQRRLYLKEVKKLPSINSATSLSLMNSSVK
jgi:type I restriction enzyme M protein